MAWADIRMRRLEMRTPHFPNLNMLKDMRGSNRFAVTKHDIIGDWSSSGSSVLQYYNVYTGANAGMTFLKKER